MTDPIFETVGDARAYHRSLPWFYFGFPKNEPDPDNVGHYRFFRLWGLRLHLRLPRLTPSLAYYHAYNLGFRDGRRDTLDRLNLKPDVLRPKNCHCGLPLIYDGAPDGDPYCTGCCQSARVCDCCPPLERVASA